MKGKLHRVGDIVRTLKHYNPSTYYYCKIIDIIDIKQVSYNEYTIITGYGELNSKVELKLLVIGEKLDDSLDITLIENEKKILKRDPHNVYLIDIEKSIKKCTKDIESLNTQIEFLKKNRNREDKLNDLLD